MGYIAQESPRRDEKHRCRWNGRRAGLSLHVLALHHIRYAIVVLWISFFASCGSAKYVSYFGQCDCACAEARPCAELVIEYCDVVGRDLDYEQIIKARCEAFRAEHGYATCALAVVGTAGEPSQYVTTSIENKACRAPESIP